MKKDRRTQWKTIGVTILIFVMLMVIFHVLFMKHAMYKTKKIAFQTIESSKVTLEIYEECRKTEGNTISLREFFKKTYIENEGVVVITTKDAVVASNHEWNYDTKIEKWEMINKDKHIISEELGRVRYDRGIWYMSTSDYREYTIYVFFPIFEVYKGYAFAFIMFILIYSIIRTLLWNLNSKVENLQFRKLEEQYRTINAISSAYMASLLVTIRNGEAEWIKIPDRIKKQLKGCNDYQSIRNKVAEIYIKENYREDFMNFVDITDIDRRIQGKGIITFTYEDLFGDWLMMGIVPQKVGKNGYVERIVYLVRNVTEERQKEMDYQKQLQIAVEQAKRADMAKTTFLRHMSHDIRTPINGIAGLMDLADTYSDDVEKLRLNRESVKATITYLLSLVNNVLDLSKLESGGITLENEAFDLETLFQEELSIIQIQANELNLKFFEEKNEYEHRYLVGSSHHLKRILMNLSGNAMKYNQKEGSMSLYYKEVASDEDTATYQFICEDTGIGMSEEFQQHAFEPFAQEGKETYNSYTGSGLGLPLVKEMVELMGGTIAFTSQENVGTKFVVTIPFLLDKNPVKVSNLPESHVDIKGKYALLVEDHRLNLKIAKSLLEAEGLIMDTAENGVEAVEKMALSDINQYDMIFMDIMMPVMNGIEATRKIRKLDRPDAKIIPIIAMTANAFKDDIENCMEAGMNAYITKPLDIIQIRQEIQKAMKDI